MRTIIGAVYGGLIALIAAFLLDILISGAALSAEGELPTWHGPVRFVGAVVIIGSGLAIGAWRARARSATGDAESPDEQA